MSELEPTKPIVLSVAGLDPSGGAGVIADIKTISALGCFPAAVVTSITFQNTTGVLGAAHQSPEVVGRQLEAIISDLEIAAVKTGMLPTSAIIREVARIFRGSRLPAPVVDPVMRATSGDELIEAEALETLTTELFPLSRVVTPNIPEAERLVGFAIDDISDMRRAAEQIQRLGAAAVLVKGGHSIERQAIDVLIDEKGSVTEFRAEFIDVGDVHGSGCTLSSAIAAGLGQRMNLVEAVRAAKRYVTERIRSAKPLGHGARPL